MAVNTAGYSSVGHPSRHLDQAGNRRLRGWADLSQRFDDAALQHRVIEVREQRIDGRGGFGAKLA